VLLFRAFGSCRLGGSTSKSDSNSSSSSLGGPGTHSPGGSDSRLRLSSSLGDDDCSRSVGRTKAQRMRRFVTSCRHGDFLPLAGRRTLFQKVTAVIRHDSADNVRRHAHLRLLRLRVGVRLSMRMNHGTVDHIARVFGVRLVLAAQDVSGLRTLNQQHGRERCFLCLFVRLFVCRSIN